MNARRITLIIVGLCLLAAVGLSRLASLSNKASAAAPARVKLDYSFESKNIMLGKVPSPVAITKVLHQGSPIALDKRLAGDDEMVREFEVVIKNTSHKDVTFAQLRLDLVDPQTDRTAATSACAVSKVKLTPGQEQTVRMIPNLAQGVRHLIGMTGKAVNLARVSVDIADTSDGYKWHYGYLMRQAPYDFHSWVVLGREEEFKRDWIARNKAPKEEHSIVNASFTSSAYFRCGKITGIQDAGLRCIGTDCYAYDEQTGDPDGGADDATFLYISAPCYNGNFEVCSYDGHRLAFIDFGC